MKILYIIAGPNGAGKTTASYTILPELLQCKEFINADEIARGLSPFNPDKSAIEAGRIMLRKIRDLINEGETFAFETTLATKSYKGVVKEAKDKGFKVILLFFYLRSMDLAISRVKNRVLEGGHDIPKDIIIRRYNNGLKNFFTIFRGIADEWMMIDNSGSEYDVIARSLKKSQLINDKELWDNLRLKYDT